MPCPLLHSVLCRPQRQQPGRGGGGGRACGAAGAGRGGAGAVRRHLLLPSAGRVATGPGWALWGRKLPCGWLFMAGNAACSTYWSRQHFEFVIGWARRLPPSPVRRWRWCGRCWTAACLRWSSGGARGGSPLPWGATARPAVKPSLQAALAAAAAAARARSGRRRRGSSRSRACRWPPSTPSRQAKGLLVVCKRECVDGGACAHMIGGLDQILHDRVTVRAGTERICPTQLGTPAMVALFL